MKRIIYALVTSFFIFSCTPYLLKEKPEGLESKINVIPAPLQVQMAEGKFSIKPETKILVDTTNEDLKAIGQYLADKIKSATGHNLSIEKTTHSNAVAGAIILTIMGANQNLGDDGYALEVKKESVLLKANKLAGLFYGVQTILQLLPPEIFNEEEVQQGIKWTMPCVNIQDKPRYSWRGMHLDVCRHFFSKEFVKTYIDYLAIHKMNVFHWHLTEDQGWRIEIKKYPKLTEIGAWRVDREDKTWNEREPQKPGEEATYGGYYTQEEIKEIVEYAQKRFITIVPEIEMPGHALAALASYPEYSCTGGPYTVATGGYWPIVDVYCPGNDSTFVFLEDVLNEVIELFPGKYFHIGGDEVNKANWEKCPKCQKRIKDEGLKDEEELQSYFIKRIETFLNSKNKKLIGWDEILEGGLAPRATVMSWRGTKGGIEAVSEGHDVVMSPTSHCYFDYYQGDPAQEPEAIGGHLPLKKVYEFEPTPSTLTPEQAKHILGAQGNVWTEYIATPEHAEYMIFPRMCALAEIVWSTKDHRNWKDFLNRLPHHLQRLDQMEANYRELDLKEPSKESAFNKNIEMVIISPRTYDEVRYTLDDRENTHQSLQFTQAFYLTDNKNLIGNMDNTN